MVSRRARSSSMAHSRISRATRGGPRLDLSPPEKDKREQEGEIVVVGVNFDRLNIAISKWKRDRLRDTISCRVSRHFSLPPSAPRRVLSSFLSPPPFLSHWDEIQKIRGTFSSPSKRRGKARERSLAPPRPRSRLRSLGIRRRINFRQFTLFAGRSISLDGHPTVRSQDRRRDKREDVLLGAREISL